MTDQVLEESEQTGVHRVVRGKHLRVVRDSRPPDKQALEPFPQSPVSRALLERLQDERGAP